MKGVLGEALVDTLINAPQRLESEIRAQRTRVAQVRERLEEVKSGKARELLSLIDQLVRRSVWIIGGDGWAYDIGSAGLDHVLASGRDVNVLVMDTEVYSNTGGQMSKSTPLGAVAKFAAGGKTLAKKDVALQAISYGNVYVARIAFGANPQQTLQALREAEAYPGPSLIIAYSHCIAHGIDMTTGMSHQRDLVKSGYLTLYHYDPRLGMGGADQPLKLDSRKPTMPLEKVAMQEGRYAMLAQSDPARSKMLMQGAQHAADARVGADPRQLIEAGLRAAVVGDRDLAHAQPAHQAGRLLVAALGRDGQQRERHLVVPRHAQLTALVELALQHRQLRDAVARVAHQAGARGVGAHALGFVVGQEQLAHRGEVQWGAASDGAHHLHARAFAVGAFHVNDLVALAHTQVHRLLDQLVQLAHGAQRGVAHAQARLDQVAQFQQAHAQPVAAGLGPVNEAADGEVVEDAVGGGRVQPRLLADLLQRDRFFA
mgnify:CR=1 FL=1